jgi:hypothetical protein
MSLSAQTAFRQFRLDKSKIHAVYDANWLELKQSAAWALGWVGKGPITSIWRIRYTCDPPLLNPVRFMYLHMDNKQQDLPPPMLCRNSAADTTCPAGQHLAKHQQWTNSWYTAEVSIRFKVRSKQG